MNLRLLGVLLAIAVAFAKAQTGMSARPEFAVASIKPNRTGCCVSGGVGNGGSGNRDVTLKMLIATAYRVQSFQIFGGPKIGSGRFDVEGKAEDPKASFDQLRLMLQSLLEDRFRLKVHRETKPSSACALVVAKGGTKIKRSDDQTSPDVNGPAPPGAGPNRGAVRMGAGVLIGNAVTMSLFVRFLSRSLDRFTIDRTNLEGRFDIRLDWAPAPWGEHARTTEDDHWPDRRDDHGRSIRSLDLYCGSGTAWAEAGIYQSSRGCSGGRSCRATLSELIGGPPRGNAKLSILLLADRGSESTASDQ